MDTRRKYPNDNVLYWTLTWGAAYFLFRPDPDGGLTHALENHLSERYGTFIFFIIFNAIYDVFNDTYKFKQ